MWTAVPWMRGASPISKTVKENEVHRVDARKLPKPSDFLGYDHFFSEGNSQTKSLRSMTRPVAISAMPNAANI